MLSEPNDISIVSLAKLSQGQDWRVTLAHDRSYDLLIWVTRGQGRLLLDGLRRGVGAHNAIFVPAGSLFALDLGRQSIGQAVILPAARGLRLPEMPRHLRIRDVHVQTELTGLIDAALREEQGGRALRADALEAHAALISVWLRRQLFLEENVPDQRNAAGRLRKGFCDLLVERYRSGAGMADFAADLGVTPTHLTRAVKAATGKTAADLMSERVLYEARKMLLETTEPAQNIARHLGFGSAAYFTRAFQSRTGETPSAFRARG